MRKSRWVRVFALLAAVTLVAAACGDDDEQDAADTTETTAEEADVEGVLITATEYEFDGLDQLHASTATVTLRNDGAVPHELALYRLPDGTEGEEFLEQFTEAVVNAEEGGPLPDEWFEEGAFTGTTPVDGGEQSVTEFSLTSGRWLAYCSLDDSAANEEGGGEGGGTDGDEPAGRAQGEEGGEEEPRLPPHYQSGMFEVIEVEGDPEPTIPEADATITAVEDGDTYSFEGTDDLEAGKQTIAFANDAGNDQAHHLIGVEFKEGVKPADVPGILQQLFASEEGGEEDGEEGGGGTDGDEPAGRAQEEEGGEEGGDGGPPVSNFELASSAVFTPGFGATVDIELTSGRTYAFLCFIQDREGGPPHAIGHGMVTAFTVK